MRRLLASASLLLLIVFAHPTSVSALSFTKTDPIKLFSVKATEPVKHTKKTPSKPVHIVPTETVYIVGAGESLSEVALKFNTTWDRLWSKNTILADPNLVNTGDKLTIPLATEPLIDRPLPTTDAIIVATQYDGTNLYESGQCTWYVKNMRPDIPNDWGDASQWIYSAKVSGWAVGSIPRVGAIGVRAGHVMYIEAVNGNYVTYSDMNGNWVPFERGIYTVSAETLTYIY